MLTEEVLCLQYLVHIVAVPHLPSFRYMLWVRGQKNTWDIPAKDVFQMQALFL